MSTVQKKKLQIDDVMLAYEEYGEGYPIIFLHGIGSSSHSWRHVAQSLSSSHRAICFDLLGFGESDKPHDVSYSIHHQAKLIRKAITLLGLKNVILVGHSMGGAACLSLMRELGEDQELVSKLVLVDSMSYLQIPPWFITALWMPILPALTGRLISKKLSFNLMKSTIYNDPERVSPQVKDEYVQNMEAPDAYPALVRTARQMIPLDFINLIKSYKLIHVPTLIIWGKQDKVIPVRNGRRLAQDILNAHLEEIDNCGHCPQEECPDQIAQLIERVNSTDKREKG